MSFILVLVIRSNDQFGWYFCVLHKGDVGSGWAVLDDRRPWFLPASADESPEKRKGEWRSYNCKSWQIRYLMFKFWNWKEFLVTITGRRASIMVLFFYFSLVTDVGRLDVQEEWIWLGCAPFSATVDCQTRFVGLLNNATLLNLRWRFEMTVLFYNDKWFYSELCRYDLRRV